MTSLESKIHGCWIGKSVGGTLGLPVEGQPGPLKLTFYDPIPTVAPPNDDLELQLVWLDLVEKTTGKLTAEDFAGGWLRHIHYMWDEYGRCRWNLRRGVPAVAAGTFENWFESSMGSPIRSEIWACLFPGDPASAGYYAALDASLDHGVEGIAGEVFFAVMQNLAASGTPLAGAIDQALARIPASSDTARAIALVMDDFRGGVEPWESRRRLLQSHGSENFTHAPLNVALTVWALCHGAENFEISILLATNGGYDTDCTAATVGATLGLMQGAENIPARWIEPIGDGIYVGPGIRGLPDAPATIGELTRRIIAATGRLETASFDQIPWQPRVPVSLDQLPGTISLAPLDGSPAVPWANGELPPQVKQAGGARWTWEHPSGEPRALVCLAREGARVFVDGASVIECPPGLPFVPATHRSPDGSHTRFTPGAGTHEVRLELDSRAADQEATLILTYPDRHWCPWTGAELPDRAVLITA